MFKVRTVLVALTAMLLLPGGPAGRSDITIEVREPHQLHMAEWAIGRYAEAGLDLPSIVILFPGRDLSLCDRARGRIDLDRDPIEIRVCWDSEFVLLHELGHAWEARNVAASEHGPFMAMRDGVSAWATLDVAWAERGREHAANVIAWGLLEDPYPISDTYPNDPDSMLDAFRFLTGVDPLHDGGPPIQLPDRTLFEGRSNQPLESGR